MQTNEVLLLLVHVHCTVNVVLHPGGVALNYWILCSREVQCCIGTIGTITGNGIVHPSLTHFKLLCSFEAYLTQFSTDYGGMTYSSTVQYGNILILQNNRPGTSQWGTAPIWLDLRWDEFSGKLGVQ